MKVAIVGERASGRKNDVNLLARREAHQAGQLVELLGRDLLQRQIVTIPAQAAQHFGNTAILLIQH